MVDLAIKNPNKIYASTVNIELRVLQNLFLKLVIKDNCLFLRSLLATQFVTVLVNNSLNQSKENQYI